MTANEIVNGLHVASPCKASWNAMTGDDRARLCSLCNMHVYNIAMMSVPEIVTLVQETEGEFCKRLYRRRDGTVITADCPVGAKSFSSGRLHGVMTLAVIAIGFFTSGAFLRPSKCHEIEGPPIGPGVTFADWKDWALGNVGVPEGFAGRQRRITPPGPGTLGR